MLEKKKTTARAIADTIKKLPAEKKEYLLGVADGMAVMAERKKSEDPPGNPGRSN